MEMGVLCLHYSNGGNSHVTLKRTHILSSALAAKVEIDMGNSKSLNPFFEKTTINTLISYHVAR